MSPAGGSQREVPLGGGGSASCARGGDTSSSRWLRPWPRSRTTAHRSKMARAGGGGGGRGEGRELKFTAALRMMPPPLPSHVAGARYFAMDTGEDTGQAPAAERPAPLLEVLPQAGLERHGGIGYELVLASAVPARFPEGREWGGGGGGEGEGEGEGPGQGQEQDEAGEGPGNS